MLGINPESRDDWGVAKVSMQRRAPRASAIACVCYCSLQSALDPAILYRHCVIARDIEIFMLIELIQALRVSYLFHFASSQLYGSMRRNSH